LSSDRRERATRRVERGAARDRADHRRRHHVLLPTDTAPKRRQRLKVIEGDQSPVARLPRNSNSSAELCRGHVASRCLREQRECRTDFFAITPSASFLHRTRSDVGRHAVAAKRDGRDPVQAITFGCHAHSSAVHVTTDDVAPLQISVGYKLARRRRRHRARR
jgi:hypothetical protein